LLPLIQLQQISFAYPGSQRLLLNQIDITYSFRQRIGLVGANGSGKTTLLHLIMGLVRPTAGQLLFKGHEMRSKEDFRKLRRSIGLVFQDADDQLFSPTVLEDVAFGPLNMGMSQQEALRVSRETLTYLGLLPLENRVTHQLSGGEKKLVALATILSMQPEVMLLDEPSNNLDTATRARLISILNRLNMGYIIISHDWDFLSETCAEVYTLHEGKIIQSSTECLHSHHHAHRSGHCPHAHEHEE
jgi:cobalt/nickel transport system ATP-binding protein